MQKRSLSILAAACILAGLSLLSCGLDDVPYIAQLPEPWHTSFSRANIDLHIASGSEYFARFTIFYKIYLSAEPGDAPFSAINPMLNTDFNAMRSWTDGTTTGTDVGGAFRARRFLRLGLEGADIGAVLGHGAIGETLEIDFSQEAGRTPRLHLNGSAHYLRRATRGEPPLGDFAPVPAISGSLPFRNHLDLLNPDNRTDSINADVAPTIPAYSSFSYVLMYIVAEGTGFGLPPVHVFSRPTFLGVFRLPQW